ncbi:hypothetical protein N9W19_00055 [bacterium]|nr:hypothetical protein [bacterium]
MATLGELLNENTNSTTTDADENSRPNAFVSALAGIGSGLFKIPEGLFSLGATLIDLGADTNKAAEVEEFFAKINPFDELAEATTAGKITELITNIGVPGGIAFKVGNGLAKGALVAKRSDKYLNLGGDMSKAISKKLKGGKLDRAENKLFNEAFSKGATGFEKTGAFGAGAGLGGLAEGVFVADVEDAGTFGDLLGGPTELERDTDDPTTEILNRLKFGLEGAGFTGIIGGVGKTISKLRNQAGTGKAITQPFDRWIDKWISKPLRSRGPDPQEGFEMRNKMDGEIAADRNAAERAMTTVDKIGERIVKNMKKTSTTVDDNTKKNLFKEMNDFLIGKRKLRYNFESVDEINIDPKTGSVYEAGFGEFEKLKPGARLPQVFKRIDPTTGKQVTQKLKTGDRLFNFRFDDINDKSSKVFRNRLKSKYKATDNDIEQILGSFKGMRSVWEDLFTQYGRRLTPDALDDFEKMIRGSLTEAMDRGYQAFKNNSGDLNFARNYPPTKAILTQATEDIQKEVTRLSKGTVKLTDEEAGKVANEIWEGSSLSKGVLLAGKQGDVVIKDAPDFFRNSIANNLQINNKNVAGRETARLSELTGEGQRIVKNLLGKAENPMSTLVEGTANLSSQVRYNKWLDNLVTESNNLKRNWDAWDKAGRVGAEPRVPFLFANSGEARKYTGGTGRDFKTISPPVSENAARGTPIGRFYDPKAKLKPIDEIEAARIDAKVKDALDNEIALASSKGKKLTKKQRQRAAEKAAEIINPIEGRVALNDYADALGKTIDNKKTFLAQLYQNTILYPKATAQMAKTILAPFTHARNFLSAAAFAGANGLLPFGNTADVKAAWNALQVAGPGTRQANAMYQELLRLGVVNSQVQLGDLRKLLEDVDFGGVLNRIGPDFNAVNTFLKKMNVAKKFAQDAYTAEDDFWKIFTYFGEKARLDKAYRGAGMQLGQEFIDPKGVKQIFNDEYLKKAAADLVKNNVPNYAFVSDFVKGLRKLPLGNFVAFPAEIMRTGTNIVDTALDEIFYTVKIGNETKSPLRNRGLQRLFGMGVTTTVLPAGAVATLQTIYDVSDEEINAMRRYVAEWSKNSTLLPFKSEDGKLEYIDYSHMNAYDTLTRPIQTVINAVNEGRDDKDGIMGDFLLGLIESTKEIGSPFISESMWTQALQDVSPILGRGGVDAQGRRIYDMQVDSVGDALSKSVAHLAETQFPLNWNQLKRLGFASVAKVVPESDIRFGPRGVEYELGNELSGIAGMRRVKIDPSKGINYKITDYKDGIRASRGIFARRTLTGGKVTPEEVVDAYIESNRALFKINREMFKDIKAAQTLGMSEESVEEKMVKRGERRAFNALIDGEFRPYSISNDVKNIFEFNAEQLGLPNPFDTAEDIIDTINEILSETPVSLDMFPDLPNPFRQSIIPNLGSTPAGQLPPMISGATPSVVNANAKFGNIPTNVGQTTAEEINKVFPNG